MPIVFVSGPYTANTLGDKIRNTARANDVADRLIKYGACPIVPHRVWGPDHDGLIDEDLIMDACYDMIRTADGVVFMSGWDKSKGCKLEMAHAKLYNKMIFYDDQHKSIRGWLAELRRHLEYD